MPIILIGISITVFFAFSNPFYNNILQLRAQVASYNEALNNSKALESERDKLTAKSNSINRDDLIKIQKLLPDSIDNIRLILEIEQIALPYGMVLKDIKYSATDTKSATSGAVATVQGGGAVQSPSKDYGVWDLEFSTIGTYNNFLNFTRDLESNLRIVDISSIQFSSNATGSGVGSTPNSSSSESYKYDFKIKTYWLKN
jgi:Tfp pilus assembly protein PilO